MISVTEVLQQAATALTDTRHVRWSKPEIIDYLNDGLSAVLIRKPNAFMARTTLTVSSNPVELPDNAYALMSVEKIGDVRGQFTPIETLDRFYPDWRVKEGVPQAWTKATDELTQFWLYPVPSKPVDVDVQYSQIIKVDGEEGFIPIQTVYQSILLDYILYRAFSKDAENASEAQKSGAHYQLFNAALADKNTTDGVKQTAFLQSAKE